MKNAVLLLFRHYFFSDGSWLPVSMGFFILLLMNSASADSGITYHGRILKPDGVTPVSSSTTQFKIQIRTPGGENCLLWEEQQTKDLSNTNGIFSLTINDTSEPTRIANTLPFGLERVFSNRTNFTGLTNCSVGTTFNPSTVDGRSLQVFFREAPTDPWEQMPATQVNYVPLSLNSIQLEGYSATEFLKIDPLSNYTPLTAANVNTLLDIVAGTSNLFLKPSTTFAGDVTGTSAAMVVEKIRGTNVVATAPTNGQVLKFNGTSWAPAADDNNAQPGDAGYNVKGVVQITTDLATSGLFISGGSLALPNVITAGGPTGTAQTVPVITYDQKGRLTAVSTATIDDTSKLPLSGGTLTGNINMGTHDITNSGSISATNFSGRNLNLIDGDTNTVTIRTPNNIAANYALTLPVDDGAAGEVLSTDGNGVLSWAPSGAGSLSISDYNDDVLPAASCTATQTPYWNSISSAWACQNINFGSSFVDGGNTMTATATIGTNSNHNLELETNGTSKVAILAGGNVGIGTTNPAAKLEINGEAKIGNTGLSCAAATKGTIRYNDVGSILEFCNGTTWTAVQTPTTCADPTPSAISFTDESNATVSTLYTSDIKQINSIDCAVTVKISGQGSPEFRICNDATCTSVAQGWTTSPSSATSGQYVQTRLTTDAVGGAKFQATLIVGSAAAVWSVTNAGGDCTASPSIGTVCADGTIYAGNSPDGGGKMFTTRCDAGQTWDGANCTGARSGLPWNNGTSNFVDTGRTSTVTGRANSTFLNLSNDAGSPYTAAQYCKTLNMNGQTDWYLPSLTELQVLYSNSGVIRNFEPTAGYNTSSELSASVSYWVRFSDGAVNAGSYSGTKTWAFFARCVRR